MTSAISPSLHAKLKEEEQSTKSLSLAGISVSLLIAAACIIAAIPAGKSWTNTLFSALVVLWLGPALLGPIGVKLQRTKHRRFCEFFGYAYLGFGAMASLVLSITAFTAPLMLACFYSAQSRYSLAEKYWKYTLRFGKFSPLLSNVLKATLECSVLRLLYPQGKYAEVKERAQSM